MEAIFQWVPFYEELADKLLEFKDRRQELFNIIKELAKDNERMGFLHIESDKRWPSRNFEIDPFSVFAIFNRGQATDESRIELARIFKDKFQMNAELPRYFSGIPVMDARKSVFEGHEAVWSLFEQALLLSDGTTDSADFQDVFEQALDSHGNGLGTITMGLFWIRPNIFLNLDSRNRAFLVDPKNNMEVVRSLCPALEKVTKLSGDLYLAICKACKELFRSNQLPFKTFPEMSHYVWESRDMNQETEFRKWMKNTNNKRGGLFADSTINAYCTALKNSIKKLTLPEVIEHDNIFLYTKLAEFNRIHALIVRAPNYKDIDEASGNGAFNAGLEVYKKFLEERLSVKSEEDFSEDTAVEADDINKVESNNFYTKEDFLKEVYISSEKYDTLKNLLRRKKNIILQGAPGVGKTFLAKRLAYSLMGEKDENRVEMVQFHQSYAYEDFIMGYKPSEKHFKLRRGAFYSFCKKAHDNPKQAHYFIIDEINRGNLSKIFGELFMLIEADKRKEEYQVRLLYKNKYFYIPENLYIIGTMNTADRSLAMLDYALRRRFAFVELNPAFETKQFVAFQQEVANPCFSSLIKTIKELNKAISEDESLGAGFQIGHSYFITDSQEITDIWIEEMIEYEIKPLLEEYWFDEAQKVKYWYGELKGILKND